MFHVYYYSRKLEGDRKLKPLSESSGTQDSDEGVVTAQCAESLIDRFGTLTRAYIHKYIHIYINTYAMIDHRRTYWYCKMVILISTHTTS